MQTNKGIEHGPLWAIALRHATQIINRVIGNRLNQHPPRFRPCEVSSWRQHFIRNAWRLPVDLIAHRREQRC